MILLFLIIIMAIPTIILYLIYRWLNKKGYKKTGITIVIIAVLYLGYSTFKAIYPDEEFYIEGFEKNTCYKFPDSNKFIAKGADYPDTHGKYTSVALVELSQTNYAYLLYRAENDSTFKTDSTIGVSQLYEEVTKGIDKNEIAKIFRKKKIRIAFLKDSSKIIFEKGISEN